MPNIILLDPKYPANLGSVVRIASAYGFEKVIYSGNRLRLELQERIPRELRMREYRTVAVEKHDRPLTPGRIYVAVEYRTQSEDLIRFSHPSDCDYVFGPEDGDIPRHILSLCHRFVKIPTKHCLNLATAVATVAYDKVAKEQK